MARNTQLELYPRPGGCGVRLDGLDVSEEIRTEEVSKNSHYIASTYAIREIMWAMQRHFREKHDLVMEGRDIGSIVFPDAQLKIYLDASVEERAMRRYRQLQEKGRPADIKEIEKDIIARDEKDRNRTIAPLLRLPDAVYIDSTFLTIEEEVSEIVRLYHEIISLENR
jgi:cytidylate kinase